MFIEETEDNINKEVGSLFFILPFLIGNDVLPLPSCVNMIVHQIAHK